MSDWFDPKNLKATEEKIAQGLAPLDPQNDYGSYKLVNQGQFEKSQIAAHNAIGESADFHAEQVALQMKKLNFNPTSIADMGCGIGAFTNSLKKYFPNAQVHGYEISRDAVEYATREFPNVKFHVAAIDEETLFDQKFDLIVCKEFYPFTRTADQKTHEMFLKVLFRNLQPKGLVVLSQKANELSIFQNLEAIQSQYHLSKISVAALGLVRRIKIYSLAKALTWVLKTLTKKPHYCLLVLRRKFSFYLGNLLLTDFVLDFFELFYILEAAV